MKAILSGIVLLGLIALVGYISLPTTPCQRLERTNNLVYNLGGIIPHLGEFLKPLLRLPDAAIRENWRMNEHLTRQVHETLNDAFSLNCPFAYHDLHHVRSKRAQFQDEPGLIAWLQGFDPELARRLPPASP